MLFKLKPWPVAFIAFALAGCGGIDSSTSSSGSELRLASEAATSKPWESTLETVSSTDTPAQTSPVKGSAATGRVAAYDPSALPVIGGEPSASASWPAWRRGLNRWQWTQIPGTDLSSIIPSPRPAGSLSARIDAWNGLAADTRTSSLFAAANGGHWDYSGNEVYQINLSLDSPGWTMLRAPTEEAAVVASDYTKGIYSDHYLDGRPASTHTYYALHFVASRSAIFKVGAGSLWGTGNEANWKTDAFSVVSNDWHPAGTWPEVVPGERGGAIGAPICIDPATEQVYVAAPDNLRRFNPATGTYSVLASWPVNSTAVRARACAVDPERKRVVFFGDAYRMPTGGLVYDIGTNVFLRIDLSGTVAADAGTPSLHFAWYEPKVGQFLLKSAIGDRVYSIDPQTFEVGLVGTVGGASLPDAMNGVNTRWQRLPNLGGYAYYPAYGSGVWFLAIE